MEVGQSFLQGGYGLAVGTGRVSRTLASMVARQGRDPVLTRRTSRRSERGTRVLGSRERVGTSDPWRGARSCENAGSPVAKRHLTRSARRLHVWSSPSRQATKTRDFFPTTDRTQASASGGKASRLGGCSMSGKIIVEDTIFSID